MTPLICTIHVKLCVLVCQVLRELVGFLAEKVLGELLTLHASTIGGYDFEAVIEEPLENLHGVELAESVQREANHVAVVHVPARVATVHESRVELWEHFLQQGAVRAQTDSLAQVGTYVDRNAVNEPVLTIRARRTADSGHGRVGGSLLLGSLQLLLFALSSHLLYTLGHGRDVVESCLLHEKLPFAECVWKRHLAQPQKIQNVPEHLSIAVNEVMLFQAV